MRPYSDGTFNFHNPKVLFFFSRLGQVLNHHLHQNRFNHGFQDSINFSYTDEKIRNLPPLPPPLS